MNTRNADALSKPAGRLAFGRERLEKIFTVALRRLHRGRLTVTLPSGNSHTFTGSQDLIDGQQFHATWQLNSYKAFRRMLRTQSVGFAESYIAGEWDSPDLVQLLELMACNMDALEAHIDRWTLVRLVNRLQHRFRSNTKSGSRRNIAYHYDLGNDFYRQWLDAGMTYSSALFEADDSDSMAGLAAAQERKYRRLAEQLNIKPGDHVLEIGCGWGGFAEFAAAKIGCRVTGVTLSREQLAFARERMRRSGLEAKVDLHYQDYREITGEFDHIISIEMFEAVGEEHWGSYFEAVRARLRPGGRAGLQIITIADERFANYRSNTDFIQKYIFPGGMLPSPERLRSEVSRAGLETVGEMSFGHDYARTLRIWRKAFLQNWASIEALGYSSEFRRLWEYYLAYCEAGFRRDTIDVGHYLIEKPAE
ncbi:MAG: class I SAM-dependent methyltransferase [Gammaproteobacteria bacterium]|nr:class I SAM-dependent methyltransferase [Gammaproteobacteria bacterium]